MNKLNNFKSAFSLVDLLHDINVNEYDFEEIGLIAWRKIANKWVSNYKITGNTDCDGNFQTPCNADIIESVTLNLIESQITSPSDKPEFVWPINQYSEYFIEGRSKHGELYTYGKLIDFEESDDMIKTKYPNTSIQILYRGIKMDEDGLPLINEKEAEAIASYIAYVQYWKIGKSTRDKATIEISQIYKQDWLKLCNQARSPMYMSQNDMDRVLDAKTNWDRKRFGKSWKPLR